MGKIIARLVGIGFTLGSVMASEARATPISPDGSLNIVLSSQNGSVTSNSPQNELLVNSTVTVSGTRLIFSTSSYPPGTYNLGISDGDVETVYSSGIYQDGNYAEPANLTVSFDGLIFTYDYVTATYQTVGSSLYQLFSFAGEMEAGTNTSTGQAYLVAPSVLTFTLQQSGSNGGQIGYSVTIEVPDGTLPTSEPAAVLVLGSGLLGLGLVRGRRRVPGLRMGR